MWSTPTLLLLLLGVLLVAPAVTAAGLNTRYDEASGRVLILTDRGGQEVELGYIEVPGDELPAAPRHERRLDEESFDFGSSRVVLRRQDRAGRCFEGRLTIDVPTAPIRMCQRHLSSHIYGGIESTYQKWPTEQNVYDHYAYVTNKRDHAAIASRYWLFSDGRAVRVHANSPLFIDQNTDETLNKLCFVAQNMSPYPENRTDNVLQFELCSYEDPRQAHEHVVQTYMGKPDEIPDERMATYPIWTVAPPEDNVRDRVANIIEHGFDYSVIEISDKWETCYGSMTVDTTKFPDMRALTDDLHALGFSVALWMHPFVNENCEPYFSEALANGYLVQNTNGSTTTRWWRGYGGVVDFTNPDAAAWWTDKLSTLRNETGIDTFRFDYGESSYVPQPAEITPVEKNPVAISDEYSRAGAQFGPMVTLRSGVESQQLPNFFLMDVIDTAWSGQNGLKTLVPKLLQLSMVGYPFVMPEQVGGAENHGGYPTYDLYIRWLQATTFMPAIRFHVKPWDFDNETMDICRNLTQLHAQYGPLIVELMKKAAEDGTPVNRPVWWVDPEDATALTIDSEYMLGDDVLVAPVVSHKAVSRDIYLPEGRWRDEVDPEHPVIQGPTWLHGYAAPLDTLPYFTRASA
ncbi:myogenesis-regulating glycosidase-like [Schistocerca americana]|uniref:myogenesis-regulating glycosidase-like n=1 Tax=Schistocerca americana TaxID=7009 RepID=UPI001F4F4333|nr:myogenesis-regulating glycosidase-like [Schistocerca americana]